MEEMTKLISTLDFNGKVCEVREVLTNASIWETFLETCEVENIKKSFFTRKEIDQFIQDAPEWIIEEKMFFLYSYMEEESLSLVKIVWRENNTVRSSCIRFLSNDVRKIFSYSGEERARVIVVK